LRKAVGLAVTLCVWLEEKYVNLVNHEVYYLSDDNQNVVFKFAVRSD
jgi:hypothetical protein